MEGCILALLCYYLHGKFLNIDKVFGLQIDRYCCFSPSITLTYNLQFGTTGLLEGILSCSFGQSVLVSVSSSNSFLGGRNPPFKIFFPLFKISPSLIISQPSYFATFCRRDIARHFVDAKECSFQALSVPCLCMVIHSLAMNLEIVDI